MERRTNSPYPRLDRPVLAIVGLLLVLSTVLFTMTDRQHDWRYYQYEFKNRVTQKFGADKAQTARAGLQQIWVPTLGHADRCTTCHQAVQWAGFESAEEPFRTHPKEILKSHPIEKFGCSSCHGGQGWAVDVDAVHGPVEHWDEPVLGASLGETYGLVDNKTAMMQMNCNVCHRYDRETKGADFINLGKKLVKEKGCRACHTINGRGGTIGPDLTYEGDKAAEQFDYSRLNGQKTAFAWHFAHLKEPKALAPETVMPNFHLSTKEAQALTVLIMSWRRSPVPAAFVPGLPKTDPRTPEEVVAEEKMKTGPGAWFVSTGCFVCHSIKVFGVVSPAQIGPDLSNAVEDVQARFGRTIDDFLASPTGTMSVVLSRQIVLTPQQKQIAIGKLREAFAEYQKQKASAVAPAASH
jgi:cytochrome c2